MNAADDAETDRTAGTPDRRDEARQDLVRKGALVVTLLVLAVALFYAFFSVSDAIRTWLQDRWVPVARSVFGIVVAGLAVFVVIRLTE